MRVALVMVAVFLLGVAVGRSASPRAAAGASPVPAFALGLGRTCDQVVLASDEAWNWLQTIPRATSAPQQSAASNMSAAYQLQVIKCLLWWQVRNP